MNQFLIRHGMRRPTLKRQGESHEIRPTDARDQFNDKLRRIVGEFDCELSTDTFTESTSHKVVEAGLEFLALENLNLVNDEVIGALIKEGLFV